MLKPADLLNVNVMESTGWHPQTNVAAILFARMNARQVVVGAVGAVGSVGAVAI